MYVYSLYSALALASTDRQTDRQTTDRKIVTDRQTDRQMNRQQDPTDQQMKRQTDQIDEQQDSKSCQTCCLFQALPMVVVVPMVTGCSGKRAGKANQ